MGFERLRPPPFHLLRSMIAVKRLNIRQVQADRAKTSHPNEVEEYENVVAQLRRTGEKIRVMDGNGMKPTNTQ